MNFIDYFWYQRIFISNGRLIGRSWTVSFSNKLRCSSAEERWIQPRATLLIKVYIPWYTLLKQSKGCRDKKKSPNPLKIVRFMVNFPFFLKILIFSTHHFKKYPILRVEHLFWVEGCIQWYIPVEITLLLLSKFHTTRF